MTKITFITFGKVKSEPIKELIEYYLMLLGKYAKTEYRALKDVDGRPVEASDLNSSFRDLGYTIAVTEHHTLLPTASEMLSNPSFSNKSTSPLLICPISCGPLKIIPVIICTKDEP